MTTADDATQTQTGEPTVEPTTDPAGTGADPQTPTGDKPLGPGGEKALAAERARAKDLEKQLAALAPLRKLAAAMAGDDNTGGDTRSEVEKLQERFAELERTATQERAARWRMEVATDSGLTPEQSAWLTGDSREELADSAAKLIAAFPKPSEPAGLRTPAPDPSQGSRGAVDLDQQIRDAEKSGNVRQSILLKAQRARTTSN